MLKQLSLAALLATALSGVQAQTAVGSATLVDTATVHAGTVTPTGFLTYMSGGDNTTGTADGTNYTIGSATSAAAMAGADHVWLQFDPTIFMSSGGVALTSVLAIPAIDHGWTSGNTGEFWEPFEFRIWGCTAATLTACTEGHITDVYTRGVDDTGTGKNADDWASVWAFNAAYSIFAITSGDRLVGGGVPGYSAGEGEIDALAITAPVPEPESLALLAGGLALMAFVARRRRER
jgi:PEP-CTERM motif